jgi:hypothetical protein
LKEIKEKIQCLKKKESPLMERLSSGASMVRYVGRGTYFSPANSKHCGENKKN